MEYLNNPETNSMQKKKQWYTWDGEKMVAIGHEGEYVWLGHHHRMYIKIKL